MMISEPPLEMKGMNPLKCVEESCDGYASKTRLCERGCGFV